MEIPYGKVFVYLITFLAYAYTGYGSGLLGNLRDAVLAAENVFGDVLKNVISVANKVKDFHDVLDAAVEEDCVFKCPGTGIKPVQNRNHIPKSNGCGSMGLQIDSQYLPLKEMTSCCNLHDICYDTCNSNKEVCDMEFKRCLYQYCNSYKNSMGDTMVKACKGAAKVLYTGTIALGCKSYLNAQQEACYCQSYGWKKEYTNTKYKKYTSGAGEL